MIGRTRKPEIVTLEDDPLWYKDAIIYELHVRAFCDSNGDGIGDFLGVVEKLDYLQDLGVTALWLLPFYPSPLRDDGYDIADYTSVNPIYGTIDDLQRLLDEAHNRGLRIITELVVNHTSDQHPWFQRARRSPPGSLERDFYVWSDTRDRFKDARIIFKDFELSNWTWDPVANSFFWHRFYSHQPDLNYDNPAVHEAVFRVLDFWLERGVDGLRLDAIPYLYERDGTTCENLPETHAFLKKLRGYLDSKYKNRVLLAEANQWPEDAVAYFGGHQGDECHMCFHFPIMPRLFMSIQMEDRFPIVDILQQTPDIPPNGQWALFLRNHDELTLEMVTEDDRDYMYRVYAHDPQARINLGIRRRLAPLLQNHRRKIELMNGLLLSLPGTPVIYYGDEIGMGDNIYLGDRNGVRTPMQWDGERNAGFSSANPQRLYLPLIIDPEFHFQIVNVEAQQGNLYSLLWWMKYLFALRKRHQAFSRGTLEMLTPDNSKTLAFLRHGQDETILVVANLSRFMQGLRVDLAAYKGMTLVDLMGHTTLPEIGETPYFMTLGPYLFHYFLLKPKPAPIAGTPEPPNITVVGMRGWSGIFRGRPRQRLEEALPGYLRSRPWFQGQLRDIKTVTLRDVLPLGGDEDGPRLTLVQADFDEGEPEVYLLPLAFAPPPDAAAPASPPGPVIARLRFRSPASPKREQGDALAGAAGWQEREGALYDPSGERSFVALVIDLLARRGRYDGEVGELRGEPERAFAAELPASELRVLESGNTVVLLGDRLVLKLYRRIEEGVQPEEEINRVLLSKTTFTQLPAVIGALRYRSEKGEPAALGLVQDFVPSEGDAWHLTLDALHRFFDNILPGAANPPQLDGPRSVVELSDQEFPAQVRELLGSYLETTRLMAKRVGELHVALASVKDNPDFAPEPFTIHYQRSLYQSMRGRIRQTLVMLRRQIDRWPEPLRDQAARVARSEDKLMRVSHRILDRLIEAKRIRCHGHLHLGHLLYTGKDFLVIDFEGEPDRSLMHRRRKRSPVRDLAGLHRSLQEAAVAALRQGGIRADDIPALEPWARFWQRWASVIFLKEYRAMPGTAELLPRDPGSLIALFDFYRLGWNISGLRHELAAITDRAAMLLRNLIHMIERE
ncbi:MAG TPA: maltose alpha-D-glucosyltransferase [Gemmataceae bacterium]|nr:maltose alpha-D-glucosyltransferase [Gemmataceae bacterium]